MKLSDEARVRLGALALVLAVITQTVAFVFLLETDRDVQLGWIFQGLTFVIVGGSLAMFFTMRE